MKKLYFLTHAVICFILIIISSCDKKDMVTYTYSDGSGNTYFIGNEKEKSIVYNPVKPKFSSSGIYDGGRHTTRKIDSAGYNSLISAIRSAVKNKKNHIENRVKMSGFISVIERNKQSVFILKPGSLEQKNIEIILREIIK